LIRSTRGLIAVGILTLIFGLIVKLPARLAVHWFAPAEAAISDIQGSAWSGSASEASVAGIYLRDVQWEFSPLRLFTGVLSYHVSATPVSGFIESYMSVGIGGAVTLSDLKASLPLEMFAGVVGIRGLQGSGSFQFDRLEIVDGLAVVADGTLQVADLVVPMVGRDSLGGYKVDFFTQNNGIAASIEDNDGVVELAGSLQVRTDRSFEFIAQVITRPQTPEGVLRQLQFLPPPDERGQQELRLEGVL
jgi:general secretion pathway protein N